MGRVKENLPTALLLLLCLVAAALGLLSAAVVASGNFDRPPVVHIDDVTPEPGCDGELPTDPCIRP